MNEVGEKLKEARKEKGYTLDDLQQITKIQKRYLVAIEEGNLEVLPGNFYARAFIKQYADTVGLDGEKLLADYTDYIPSPNDKNYTEKMATTQTRSRNKKNDWAAGLQQNLPVILIGVLVVAIVAAIYIAIVQNGSGTDETRIVEDTADSVQIATNSAIESQEERDTSTEEEATQEEETDTTEETEEEPEQSVEVESTEGANTTYVVSGTTEENTLSLIAEGEDSWVSVEADGDMVDQGLITSGNSMDVTFPGETESVFVVVGNSPVTTVELNGETVSYPPEADGVITQRLTFQFSDE